jgi:hypothetical protein
MNFNISAPASINSFLFQSSNFLTVTLFILQDFTLIGVVSGSNR